MHFKAELQNLAYQGNKRQIPGRGDCGLQLVLILQHMGTVDLLLRMGHIRMR